MVEFEFLPELSYEFSDGLVSAQPAEVSFSSFNMNLNINVYPLDFYNDCDCPTFSKEGGPLEKGFHFIISPGVRYYKWDNALWFPASLWLYKQPRDQPFLVYLYILHNRQSLSQAYDVCFNIKSK